VTDPAGPITRTQPAPRAEDAPCDYCGSRALVWRKCKLICEQCRQINKSCADL